MDYDFKLDGCLRGFCAKGCGRQNKQLNTYDYLADVPGNDRLTDLVEVQFKNTRKGYFRNDNHLPLEKGDMVAVEASPGHDIGVVTLTGQLVPLQMKKANRKARQVDLDKYEESKALEEDTMIRARQIAKELELNMKIGDVEYQGDGNKAIFYYIADARVDFRKLIKVLADAFHVRIEMRQIGARQEAGRIGGIGPCGRELCCATWMKNFNSVSTAAARFQDISPNPQKLAGQCAKLKCCLNYEADTYVEASRKLPPHDVTLETADSTYFYFKADILAGLVTYSTDKRLMANAVTISAERAHEVIRLNRAGEKPLKLDEGEHVEPLKPVDLAEQDDLTRFDKVKRRNGKGGNRSRKQGGDAASQNSEAATAQQGERGEQRRDRQRSERNQRRDRQRPDRQQAPDGSHRPDNNRRAAKNRPDRNAQRPGNRQAEENADKQSSPSMRTNLCALIVLPLTVALFSVLFVACDRQTALAGYHDLPLDGWEAGDTVAFPLDSVTEGGDYLLTLSLRFTASERYPFSDIALLLTRCLPGDTLTMPLRYTLTTGRSDMAGNGVSLYAYDFPIDTLSLEPGTKGRFILKHNMRLSPLPGIHDVGLSLRRLE